MNCSAAWSGGCCFPVRSVPSCPATVEAQPRQLSRRAGWIAVTGPRGQALAILSATVGKAVAAVLEKGVARGFLGFELQSLRQRGAASPALSWLRSSQTSRAEQAGFVVGDLITAWGGERLDEAEATADGYRWLIERRQKGFFPSAAATSSHPSGRRGGPPWAGGFGAGPPRARPEYCGCKGEHSGRCRPRHAALGNWAVPT